jgi:hypothetical protein
MIQESPGFYFTMATLFGAVGVGMAWGTVSAFEAEQTLDWVFSLSMAIGCAWLTRLLCRRALALGKKEPIQAPETTRGK